MLTAGFEVKIDVIFTGFEGAGIEQDDSQNLRVRSYWTG